MNISSNEIRFNDYLYYYEFQKGIWQTFQELKIYYEDLTNGENPNPFLNKPIFILSSNKAKASEEEMPHLEVTYKYEYHYYPKPSFLKEFRNAIKQNETNTPNHILAFTLKEKDECGVMQTVTTFIGCNCNEPQSFETLKFVLTKLYYDVR